MHRNSIAAFLLAAFAALALPATQLMAAVIPPSGLAPGSSYQLVFVTADTILGSYGTEAPYNTFATTEADLSSSLPSATWNAVTSTADGTSANSNAPSGGYPVYNTQGILVAAASTGLYTVPLLAPIEYNQFGNEAGPTTWTGSDSTGAPVNDQSLGDSVANIGNPRSTASGPPNWIQGSIDSSGNSLPIYSLSGPITLAPEPATLTLLGSAFLLLGGMRLRRRRRA